MKIQNIGNQMLNFNPIQKAQPISAMNQNTDKKGDFKSLLDTVDGIEKNQLETKNTIYNSLVKGEGSTHDVIMAMQQAESQIKTASMVRDKLVQAYQEIMRVQL